MSGATSIVYLDFTTALGNASRKIFTKDPCRCLGWMKHAVRGWALPGRARPSRLTRRQRHRGPARRFCRLPSPGLPAPIAALPPPSLPPPPPEAACGFSRSEPELAAAQLKADEGRPEEGESPPGGKSPERPPGLPALWCCRGSAGTCHGERGAQRRHLPIPASCAAPSFRPQAAEEAGTRRVGALLPAGPGGGWAGPGRCAGRGAGGCGGCGRGPASSGTAGPECGAAEPGAAGLQSPVPRGRALRDRESAAQPPPLFWSRKLSPLPGS